MSGTAVPCCCTAPCSANTLGRAANVFSLHTPPHTHTPSHTFPYLSSYPGIHMVTFEDALRVADFFSLHMPLTPVTKDLFNGGYDVWGSVRSKCGTRLQVVR